MQVYLGTFDTEGQAARAYGLAAVKCLGQAAMTNFPMSDYDQELKHLDSVTMEGLLKQLHMQGNLKRQGKGSNQYTSQYRGVSKHKCWWRAQIKQVRWRTDFRNDAKKNATRDACAVYRGFMLLRSLWPDVVYVCFHPFCNSCCTFGFAQTM